MSLIQSQMTSSGWVYASGSVCAVGVETQMGVQGSGAILVVNLQSLSLLQWPGGVLGYVCMAGWATGLSRPTRRVIGAEKEEKKKQDSGVSHTVNTIFRLEICPCALRRGGCKLRLF
jgi:hypothetical protein